MNRAINALREWTEVRNRVHDEHQFHLGRLTADFRALGLSGRAAHRAACGRFGSHDHLQLALREIGGDWAALPRLFRAHRVHASQWFHPILLATAILLLLPLIPRPLAVIEAIAGQPFSSADRGAVFISQQGRNLMYVGITKGDFASIHALDGLSQIERYQSIHARAHVMHGATIAAIESVVRAKTGNRRLRVVPLFERQPLVMGPAKAIWVFMTCCGLFFAATLRRSLRWLIYGTSVGCLHALTSLLFWALTLQIWNRISWSTDGRALLGFLFLIMFYLGMVAFQCRVFWCDLRQRCPCCLERLLLPLTQGSRDCLLLNSASTESICAHGHGVLVETRWSSQFRSEQSPIQGLVNG